MYKVLLVDDEILVRKAVGKKLEWNQLGFELVGDCENGKDAIEFIKEHPVDVVLTDICMPRVDGMGLSKWLYENCPQTTIIIFSGYSDFEYAKQALQYKVAEYILKPVTAKELSEVLSRIKQKLDRERKQEQRMDTLSKAYRNYTKNEALIIGKALQRLVQGTQDSIQCLQELDEFGVRITGSAFRVAAVDIDLYAKWQREDESELKKESALMAFVVENISSEIVQEHNAGIAYRDSDNRICILFWTNRPKEFRKEVEVICEEIQENVYQAMKLCVSIAVGCYVDTPERLYQSYECAAEALKFRYSKGMGSIFDCEENICEADFKELSEELKTIASAIRSGREDQMEERLDYIESWIQDRLVGRNRAWGYLNRLLHVVYDTVKETEETFTLPESVVSAVASAYSIKEAMKLVREYAGKGMEARKRSGQTSGERQAVMALDYMREHYADTELGLNQICEYLNISTSRFSSIFKESTGMTFIEALSNIRMEKAKQLLCQTKLKNYEIAEKVGFSDPHYFSIAFKKATGMTPKEFARENG